MLSKMVFWQRNLKGNQVILARKLSAKKGNSQHVQGFFIVHLWKHSVEEKILSQDGRRHLFAKVHEFGNVFAELCGSFITKIWEYCLVLLHKVFDNNLHQNLFVFRCLSMAKVFVYKHLFLSYFFAKWHGIQLPW
jgi:hypothetical protein